MMRRKKPDLLERAKLFALRIVRLYSALPRKTEAQVIGKQLLRAGTSVGAHLREGKRSRSDAEMISKSEGGTTYRVRPREGGIAFRPDARS